MKTGRTIAILVRGDSIGAIALNVSERGTFLGSVDHINGARQVPCYSPESGRALFESSIVTSKKLGWMSRWIGQPNYG